MEKGVALECSSEGRWAVSCTVRAQKEVSAEESSGGERRVIEPPGNDLWHPEKWVEFI